MTKDKAALTHKENIQSANYPLKAPFVERRTFHGGFNDLTQYAVNLEKWLSMRPGKTAIDYDKWLGKQ